MQKSRPFITMTHVSALMFVFVAHCLGATPGSPDSPQNQSREEFVDALGLKEITVGPMWIFYGASLAPELNEIRNLFEKTLRHFSDQEKQMEKLWRQSDLAIEEVNRLVGWKPEAEFFEQQKRIFRAFLTNTFSELLFQDPRIFLPSKAESKAYLKTGKTIPGMTYDPAADRVRVEFVRAWSSKDQASKTAGHFVLPADSLREIAEYLEGIE